MAQSQMMLDRLHEQFIQTAANIIRYHKGDERKNVLKELRDEVEKTYMLQRRIRFAMEVKDRLLATHDTDNATTDDVKVIVEEYKKIIHQINEDMTADEKLLDYDNKVKALLQTEESDNQENDDEELGVTQEQINVIDPVTKKRMVDPMKNKICGHVYDRQTVAALLKVKKKARCPVPGCKSKDPLSLGNLESDIVVKQYLQRHPE